MEKTEKQQIQEMLAEEQPTRYEPEPEDGDEMAECDILQRGGLGASELQWYREQFAALVQKNEALQHGFSAAAQEASTLRRQLAARAPTLRERAAIAVSPMLLQLAHAGQHLGAAPLEVVLRTDAEVAAYWAVKYADALVAGLKNG